MEDVVNPEIERIKQNFWRFCHEMADRINNPVAPDGYRKADVTCDICDSKHLKDYITHRNLEQKIDTGMNSYIKFD